MRMDELKDRAASLPMEPGVYMMKDKSGQVIYVGKAKKLRNRVSQYFQDHANHSTKTRLMVSKVDSFDVIIAASEFEALILECSLIKRYMPKYNILLKDDKGFPYIRLDMKQAYPTLKMVSKVENDNADYFGPFGSRSITQDLIDTIRLTLKLPGCSKQFPRDIGKGRPCLNYHMNQCAGWCQPTCTADSYKMLMEQVRQLLQGNYKGVSGQIRQQMLAASDELNFELAAALRDRLNAFETLGKKQLVTAGSLADTDVIGYAQTHAKACFTVLHFSNGNLLDKEYEILNDTDDPQAAVSSLLKQYYLSRGFAPKRILLPFETEDSDLFSQLLEEKYGRKTKLLVPVRGDNLQLVKMAVKNAQEEAERITTKEEKTAGTLLLLGKMLHMEPPKRIEAFDISNISGTDIVASMVVFHDGKPKKSDYKRFKIEDLQNQDDYASMYHVIHRRFSHFKNGDTGFDNAPDLLLIDGGVEHAQVACKALSELELSFPVFGMVKDDRHRTRALVTPDKSLIAIDAQQSVFALIGTIQEETHRFAITYHRKLRNKRLQYSELDKIENIGPVRKQLLLKQFKSLSAIADASLDELERILPKDAAYAVYKHFTKKKEG